MISLMQPDRSQDRHRHHRQQLQSDEVWRRIEEAKRLT